MEIEVMEIQKINDIIDKHMQIHKELIGDIKLKMTLCRIIDEVDLENELMEELSASASAIAALEMLRREVNGEVEY